MRCRVIAVVITASAAFAACERVRGSVRDTAAPAPIAVTCADAAQLRQRALEDRRLVTDTRSDNQRIIFGNRANFFASLATVADLKCRTTSTAADAALARAFDAARAAESTRSDYEKAQRWSDAGFAAGEATGILIRQLPATTSK